MSLNSKERIEYALNLKQPDRVPLGELVIDPKIINSINKKYKDVVDFAIAEGIDLISTSVKYKKIRHFKDSRYMDEWGIIYKDTEDLFDHPISGPIKIGDSLRKFDFPDPKSSERLGELGLLVNKAKGKLAINFHCRVAFMQGAYLVGLDNLLMSMITEPDFVHELLDKISKINIEVMRRAIREGADTISLGDDYCGDNGPFMSSEMFREFILPNLKKAVKAIHEEGGKCIKHTDGYVIPIMDHLIEADIDCIHPLEPHAGVDILEVKEKYGKKVCLMGNIDCNYILTRGTKNEVIQEVKDCIMKASKGGGHIISSSNSIHSGVRPENYLIMIDTAHKYGKYEKSKC